MFAPRRLVKESGSIISGFPVEILATIFKMMHSDLLEEYSDDWEEVSDDKLASPSLFPYSISTVCRYWDAIMASSAEFWTRIVVWIDQPDHLELLKLSISRAQSLKLHSISVIRSSKDSSLIDPLEKSKVQDILCVLSGHWSDFQSLFIKTLTTDSLPPRVRTAWELQTLRLESHQRGPHTAPPNPIPISNHTVYCDNLYFLSLTGPIFATLWRDEKWRQALRSRCLGSLTIAHLRAEDGGEKPFTFQELWRSFRDISPENLSWINIDVPYDSDDRSTGFDHHDYLTTYSFTFDTVPASVLRAFYDHLRCIGNDQPISYIQLQNFRNCSFFGCPRWEGFPFTSRIEVSGISNSDSLSLLFEIADTGELLIHDCPGLDNPSMNALIYYPSRHYEKEIVLPCMSSLEIRDCPNFSVSVLQEFVNFRKVYSQSDGNRYMASEIVHLSLAGLCPPLSEDEKEWFKENVERFEYENLG